MPETTPNLAPGSVVTLAPTAPEQTPLVCEHCGASFVPRRRRRHVRFCRSGCRSRWHAQRKAALFAALDETLTRAAELLRELKGGAT